MSLIPCSERCLYQKEGYCYCDQEEMRPPTGQSQADGCLYFTHIFPQTRATLLAQNPEGFQNI